MKNNKLFTVFILLFTVSSIISCVSSDFKSYKSIDGFKKNKEYYEITEPDGRVNYATIGIHTIYNRQNNYSIYIAFNNKLMTAMDIRSSAFGKIDKSKNDKVFIKNIDGKKITTDTIYISLPNKVYTFYYKEKF